MDYASVQNGMQMNFFELSMLIGRHIKISGTKGTKGTKGTDGASMSLLG